MVRQVTKDSIFEPEPTSVTARPPVCSTTVPGIAYADIRAVAVHRLEAATNADRPNVAQVSSSAAQQTGADGERIDWQASGSLLQNAAPDTALGAKVRASQEL
jgi:hypothetical protein